jgi:hypothetical protein
MPPAETPMPRYYFADSQNAADIADDDEGLEFDSFADACNEAERALREIAVDAKAQTLWMSVFDEDRKLVHRARLEVIWEVGGDC